jgi:eukaryotic-like serine/threonine-protein kinase
VIGTTLQGKYKLLRLLGDGGMGSVYEAEHILLASRVAVKILHRDLTRREGIAERFLQEARVSARIRSSRVVQIHDVEQTPDGIVFMVMELLVGESLGDLLHRTPRLSVATALVFTDQILEALEAAHALPVVHRDLKPDNVIVMRGSTGEPALKLIDFGIAKAQQQAGDRNLTVAGMVMGTAEYMAPEQAFSADKVDGRADLYALGVMLFEMIAGKRPLSGEDPRVIALRIDRGEVPPLRSLVPEVPPEVAGFVHHAMAPRPELRFSSASEMRAALRRLNVGAAPATAHVQAAGVQTTGTVMGDPVPAAVQAAMAAQAVPQEAARYASTRPPPGTAGGHTAAGQVPSHAAGHAPAYHVPAHVPAHVPGHPNGRPVSAPPAVRSRKTPLWPFALFALALGGAIVFAIVYLSSEEALPVQPPPAVVVAAPATAPKPSATPHHEVEAPLATLVGTGTQTVVPPPATTKPPLSKPSTTAAPPQDAGPVVPPFVLPSGFPTVLPTAFPTAWQIPTFPPFPPPQ